VRAIAFGEIEQAQARARLDLASSVFTVLFLGWLMVSAQVDQAHLVVAVPLLNRCHSTRLALAEAEHQGYGRSLVELGRGLGL
jgi:hypothetical protein